MRDVRSGYLSDNGGAEETVYPVRLLARAYGL